MTFAWINVWSCSRLSLPLVLPNLLVCAMSVTSSRLMFLMPFWTYFHSSPETLWSVYQPRAVRLWMRLPATVIKPEISPRLGSFCAPVFTRCTVTSANCKLAFAILRCSRCHASRCCAIVVPIPHVGGLRHTRGYDTVVHVPQLRNISHSRLRVAVCLACYHIY